MDVVEETADEAATSFSGNPNPAPDQNRGAASEEPARSTSVEMCRITAIVKGEVGEK